jgi:hypothetical protein
VAAFDMTASKFAASDCCVVTSAVFISGSL